MALPVTREMTMSLIALMLIVFWSLLFLVIVANMAVWFKCEVDDAPKVERRRAPNYADLYDAKGEPLAKQAVVKSGPIASNRWR